MPQFPRREPEMAMLARLVTDGLAKAREDFPSPPVPASELELEKRTTTAPPVGRDPGQMLDLMLSALEG